MTLQGFDKTTGNKTQWVAVPLELVDWMKEHFDSDFTQYLASLNPYSSVKVLDDQVQNAVEELSHVLQVLRVEKPQVPEVVDLFGAYGLAGAKKTVEEMINFFQLAATNEWKVVSIGD